VANLKVNHNMYTATVQSLSDIIAELDDDVKIRIGSFAKTKKELLRTLEDETQYKEIYSVWSPDTNLTPSTFQDVPKMVMRDYIKFLIADFAIMLDNLPSNERNGTKMVREIFKREAQRFNIDSIELREMLENYEVSPQFIDSFLLWLFT